MGGLQARWAWGLETANQSFLLVTSLESAPLSVQKQTSQPGEQGNQPHRQPRAVFDTQSDSGLPLWLDLQGHRQVSLWLGEGSEAQALSVRACMTKVDQQTEGLEGAPGHLLQAASLIASVSHFSISSPQTTASCSGLCICHLHLSTQNLAQDWSGGSPTDPGLPQKRG